MPDSRPPDARPAVVFLLPVWGQRYVTQFLDLSLRTLLAAGNIPAMAEACDCTFRFLILAGQEACFRGHPMFDRLSRSCAVEFVAIDDLVHPGVHSLTVTLGYVRGMRASGHAMTRTYFVFLVADYVMADGSLRHLLRHVQDGVSGVTAGNFQIVKEDAEPVITSLVAGPDAPLSIPPRALLRIAFAHLHPVALASMPASAEQTILCNRLLWRAGDDTLVARFYVRHMLCIRPEIDSFEVGSSCDYSFIPEMCPSGRVVALDDSDGYCVIEMQPRLHEAGFIVPGALTPRRLASYLSDWATAEHRRNAHTAVVFHIGDVPDGVGAVVAASADFVRRAERKLPAVPQPHRGHPYWRGALSAAAEHAERRRRFDVRAPFTRSLAEDLPAADGDRRMARMRGARRLYERLTRSGLVALPWSPSWLDSRAEARAVLAAMREPSGLVVAAQATAGTDWIARRSGGEWRLVTPATLAADGAPGGPFAVCLLYLPNVELSSLPDMLRRIRPHLAAGAHTIAVIGGRWRTDPREAIAAALPGLAIERLEVVRSFAFSAIGRTWTRILRRASMTFSPARWGWAAIRLFGLGAALVPANFVRAIGPAWGEPTTVLVTLRGPVERERAHV